MPTKPRIKIMLSSSVYGSQHIIESIFATLESYGYHVLCSHMGTVYVKPGFSTEEASLAAVEECDFFLGIIFPYYGSGITHKELIKAVELNKPRGFLAHYNIPFLRTLLKQFMYDEEGNRTDFKLKKKTTVLDSLAVIDMYNLAIGDGDPTQRRLWAQEFNKFEIDGNKHIATLFEDYPRFESDLNELKNGK